MKKLQKSIVKFRNDRNWKQFHDPKDMAISLSLEAAELLEHFQWKKYKKNEDIIKSDRYQGIKEEIMDVLYWVLLISYDLKINIEKEFVKKMKKNEAKYPIDKAKGKNKKYTEL